MQAKRRKEKTRALNPIKEQLEELIKIFGPPQKKPKSYEDITEERCGEPSQEGWI